MPIYHKSALVQSCEHKEQLSHLAGDVRPVVLAAKVLQILLEESTHLNDTVGHALDLAQPLLVELGVIHNGRGDASTVDGRVGVEGTDEDLDLRVDTLLLLSRFADERESTNTFAVETLVVQHGQSLKCFHEVEQPELTMFLAKLWHRAML